MRPQPRSWRDSRGSRAGRLVNYLPSRNSSPHLPRVVRVHPAVCSSQLPSIPGRMDRRDELSRNNVNPSDSLSSVPISLHRPQTSTFHSSPGMKSQLSFIASTIFSVFSSSVPSFPSLPEDWGIEGDPCSNHRLSFDLTLIHGARSPARKFRLDHAEGGMIPEGGGLDTMAGSSRSFSHTSTLLTGSRPIRSSSASFRARSSRQALIRSMAWCRGNAKTELVRFGWKNNGGARPSGKSRYGTKAAGSSGRPREGTRRRRRRCVDESGKDVCVEVFWGLARCER